MFLKKHRIEGETDKPDEFIFLLELDGEPGGVEYLEGGRPELPTFDPRGGNWTVAGHELTEFASHVEGVEVGPHGSNPFVIVTLPDKASIADYQAALASLAWHGICRVGVYSPESNREFVSLRADDEPAERTLVPVYRLLTVKSDKGQSNDCIDRFPAWTPWAIQHD